MSGVVVSRNDPCHCGSGKKFKKCCQPRMSGGAETAPRVGRLGVAAAPAAVTPAPGASVASPSGEEEERVIGTTPEHPFYVQGKGWTPVRALKQGDLIRTEDGWVPVLGLRDTGQCETVYNWRVADFHTYFVGSREWGFGA